MVKTSYIRQLSLQFAASSRHWIVYEGVLVLDMTIFDGWHCEYDSLWHCIHWVKIFKRKMTISHEVEWSWSRLKMFRDHNNIIEKGASVRFERGGYISFANAWFICLTNNSCKMQQIVISREPKLQWRSQNMLWAWEDIEDNDTSLVFELQWRIGFIYVGRV